MPIGERFPTVVAAARAGEDWAWSELYRDLGPALLRFLVGQGAVEPEDCLAECFLQLVRGLPRFTGDETAFRTWAFQIARNRAIDSWRAAGRRPQVASPDLQAHGGDAAAPADSAAGQAQVVEQILKGLTEDQRTVVLLRVLDGFSVTETASIMARTPGAVRVLQHRALAQLRRRGEP